MGDPLPPDPYKALGIAKDATTAQIKTAYKKAALKCHPDKAADKNAAADEFHLVNQAYELLADDEKRQKYEDQLRLSQLRREVYGGRPGPAAYASASPGHSRGNSGDHVRPSPFAAQNPRNGGGSIFTPGTSDRLYEERRPRRRSYEEDPGRNSHDSYFAERDDMRASSRKYEGYTASARQPPRSPRATPSPRTDSFKFEKTPPKARERAENKRQRDQEFRRQRKNKYEATAVDVSDEDDYFHASRDRHTEQDNSSRRRDADRSGPVWNDVNWGHDQRSQKYANQESELRAHISSKRVDHSPPPMRRSSTSPPYRSQSFSQQQSQPPPPPSHSPGPVEHVEPEIEVRRSKGSGRPSLFKSKTGSKLKEATSSARRASTGKENSRRSSRPPEIVEERRPPPQIQTSFSSPTEGGKLASMSKRRATAVDDYEDKPQKHPGMTRAETMPIRPGGPDRSSSSRSHLPPHRRSEVIPPPPIHGSSNLRNVDHIDSGYSTSSPSEEPQVELPPKKHVYRYGSSDKEKTTAKSSPYLDGDDDFDGPGFRGPGVVPDIRQPTHSSSRRPFTRSPSPNNNNNDRPERERERDRDQERPRDRESRERPSAHTRTSSSTAANATSKHSGYDAHSRNDRAAGPPPARSASYNYPASRDRERDDSYDRERDRDRDRDRDGRTSGPSSRRPSVSRKNSSTHATNNSNMPQMPRANTMPAPKLDTRGSISGNANANAGGLNVRDERNGMLFNEVPPSTSPVDYYNSSGPESGRERERDREHRDRDRDRDRGEQRKREASDRERERDRSDRYDREREREAAAPRSRRASEDVRAGGGSSSRTARSSSHKMEERQAKDAKRYMSQTAAQDEREMGGSGRARSPRVKGLFGAA